MTEPRQAGDPYQQADQKLIIALDVDSSEGAMRIVDSLDDFKCAFKIGLQLFSVGGRELVEKLVSKGHKVFLDLKFHDIPTTVAKAGLEAAKMGVWMFNVHALGGQEMMQKTAEYTNEYCEKHSVRRPHIIAVTLLTGSDSGVLDEIGIVSTVSDQVLKLTEMTINAGLDGVVASAQEASIIRSLAEEKDFLIVTPGIRPISATNDDQKRVMTPREALSAGANFIVVGRPVTGSPDPRRAVEEILEGLDTLS